MAARKRIIRKRAGTAGDAASGRLPPIVQRTTPLRRKRRAASAGLRSRLRGKLKFARRNNMRRMSSRLVYGGPGFTTLNQWDAIQVPRSIPATDVSAFTVFPSLFRATFPTHATHNTYWLFQWCAGGVRGVSWLDQGPITPSTRQSFASVHATNNLNNFNNVPPNMIRPLRSAVRVRNTTKLSDVSGAVRVLNSPHMNQYIGAIDFNAALGLTTAGVTSFKNLVEQNPSVVTHAAATFLRTQRFVIPPASVGGYEQWSNFTYSVTDSVGHTNPSGNTDSIDLQWQRSSDLSQCNFLLLQFEPAASNTYEISYHSIDACRFAANTPFAAMATMPSKLSVEAQAASIKMAQTSIKIFGEPDPNPGAGTSS